MLINESLILELEELDYEEQLLEMTNLRKFMLQMKVDFHTL